jgi:hypothetical protein
MYAIFRLRGIRGDASWSRTTHVIRAKVSISLRRCQKGKRRGSGIAKCSLETSRGKFDPVCTVTMFPKFGETKRGPFGVFINEQFLWNVCLGKRVHPLLALNLIDIAKYFEQTEVDRMSHVSVVLSL